MPTSPVPFVDRVHPELRELFSQLPALTLRGLDDIAPARAGLASLYVEMEQPEDAKGVYERMAAGDTAREAVIRGCEVFGEEWSLGLIAVGPVDWAVAANREMAWGQAAP